MKKLAECERNEYLSDEQARDIARLKKIFGEYKHSFTEENSGNFAFALKPDSRKAGKDLRENIRYHESVKL